MSAVVLLVAAVLIGDGPPPCWIRDDPADLELRISPLDSATTTLNGDTLKLCYSRPHALGRPIMGRLVPFGAPWRLGANEATTLHTPVPLIVGGVRVEPGAYTLYVIPDSTTWQFVVNTAVQRWGVPINDDVRTADLGETTVPVEHFVEPVDDFTMRFERMDGDAVDIVIEWERTRIRVPVRRAGS